MMLSASSPTKTDMNVRLHNVINVSVGAASVDRHEGQSVERREWRHKEPPNRRQNKNVCFALSAHRNVRFL
jgi:hypothetical protein